MGKQRQYLDAAAAFCQPAYLRLLLCFAEREGADLTQLMAGCSLSWPELEQRTTLLGFDDVCHIVRACQRAVGRPTLALEAGLQVDTAAHGLLSALLASSVNLRQGVHALQKFLATRTRTFDIELERGRDGLLMKIRVTCEGLDISAFLLDYMAAVSSRMLRIVAGPAMQQVRLELPWSEPGWGAGYLQLAGSLKFRAPHMAFWLPSALLDAPNPTASASHFQLAWQQAEAQLGLLNEAPTLQQRIIAQLGVAQGQAWPTAEQVAATLAISRRTLINHLQQEGTSFRAVLDTVRRERALWQLQYTQTAVADIALALGYRDVSNFSRVFRRWFGAPPQSVRKGPWPFPVDKA